MPTAADRERAARFTSLGMHCQHDQRHEYRGLNEQIAALEAQLTEARQQMTPEQRAALKKRLVDEAEAQRRLGEKA